MKLIHRHVDRLTARRWVSILGLLHLGFGPDRWLERIWWRGRPIWANRTAVQIHRLKAMLYEAQKEIDRLEHERDTPDWKRTYERN